MTDDIKIITRFNDYEIKQQVSSTYDLPGAICEHIMNLRDQGVREALVRLGWTPPGDHHAAKTKAEEAELAAAQELDEVIAERDALKDERVGLRQVIARLGEENRALYRECEERMVHADLLRDDLQEYHDQFGDDPIALKHDMGAALRNTPDTSLARLKAEWQAEALEHWLGLNLQGEKFEYLYKLRRQAEEPTE